MSRRWISGLLASLFVVALFVAMPTTKAHAVLSIEPTGETPGDVAIFPFYDVSSDTKYNYFYLVNTVNYWMQVHIRFRTMECSIECLDFDVILSPYDVFVFWVFPDIDGLGPGFYSDDSNTIDYSGLMPDEWKSGSPTVAKAPFDIKRLRDLKISESDAQEMMKRGYVEAIVEGLVDRNFWSHCGGFDSLVEAAKVDIADSCPWDASATQTGPWTAMAAAGGYANLDNVGKAGWYPLAGGAWGALAGIDDASDIWDGTLIYGNEYFVDFGPLTGYGVNAATITGFRVYETADNMNALGGPRQVTHIDDGYNYQAGFGANLRSGMNGLILHADYYQTDSRALNPFYRPDWATTFGPTLAYGDDFDDSQPLVYGSIDEIEENWFTNMMNNAGRYSGHYFSTGDGSLNTYVLLNFFTKHYHYFTKLLYDPRVPTTFTHGYVDGTTGTYKGVSRMVASDYNIDLPNVAPCHTDHWNVKFLWTCWNIAEHHPEDQLSPGTLVSFEQEVVFRPIGPNRDYRLYTGDFTAGWFELGNFVLDVDDARAETVCSGNMVTPINGVGGANGCAGPEIYDVTVGAADQLRFVPAVGYFYVEVPGYGQWKWDLTIIDSPAGPSPQP